VATSAATVVGVWESVFAYQKLWNLNNIAMADLDGLKRQADSESDEFCREFDRIISATDRVWIDTYSIK
jgi:hypothetical protein